MLLPPLWLAAREAATVFCQGEAQWPERFDRNVPSHGWNDYHCIVCTPDGGEIPRRYWLQSAFLAWPLRFCSDDPFQIRRLLRGGGDVCVPSGGGHSRVQTPQRKIPRKYVSLYLRLRACAVTPCSKASHIFTVQFAARRKKSSGHGASLSISYLKVRSLPVLFLFSIPPPPSFSEACSYYVFLNRLR